MSGSASRRDRGKVQGSTRETDPRRARPPALPRTARRSSAASASSAVAVAPDGSPDHEPNPPVPAPVPTSPRATAGEIAALQVAPCHGRDDDTVSLPAALWRAAPCWLLSALVHIALLMVLLLTWISPATEQKGRLLVARLEGIDAEELDFSTLHDQLDDVELEQADALPVAVQDPGTANLAEVGAVELDPAVDTGQLATGPRLDEIGALFGTDGKGWAAAGAGRGGAEFYGIRATGNRFVFVVDGSRSMARNQRWISCKRELLAAVSRLRPTQYFYVYLFSRRTNRMFGDADPVRQMVPATPQNIYRLRRWLDAFQLQSATVPHEAMKETLERLRPDAVYLLSDGQFTDGGESEQYMLNFAQAKKARNHAENDPTSTRYRIVVHTIAFASRKGEVVLRGIAQAFRGSFRYVPAYQ